MKKTNKLKSIFKEMDLSARDYQLKYLDNKHVILRTDFQWARNMPGGGQLWAATYEDATSAYYEVSIFMPEVQVQRLKDGVELDDLNWDDFYIDDLRELE